MKKIKLTQVASDEIEGLDPQRRKMLIAAIQDDLVRFADDSPLVTLEQLDTDVHVFPIEPLDMRVLYKQEDVDADGEPEFVILTVLDSYELSHFQQEGQGRVGGFKVIEDLPRSARIGHEVLHKIREMES